MHNDANVLEPKEVSPIEKPRIKCNLCNGFPFPRHIDKFDIVIVDDATQCSELSTVIPLAFQPTSLILFGDTFSQPITKSVDPECNRKGFYRSLFHRILDCLRQYTHECFHSYELQEQYRMSPGICDLVNGFYYKNTMRTTRSVAETKEVLKPFLVLDVKAFVEIHKSVWLSVRLFYLELKKIAKMHDYTFTIILPTMAEVKAFQCYGVFDNFDHIQLECVTANNALYRETDVLVIWITRNFSVNEVLSAPVYLQKILSRTRKSVFICGDFQYVEVRTNHLQSIFFERY